MELLLAIVAGVLYATGLYLMLRRRLAQLIIGLGLLSNGSNILILAAAGVKRAKPPLITDPEMIAAPGVIARPEIIAEPGVVAEPEVIA